MSPKSPENTERINVFFSKTILDKLKGEASDRGMTVSGLVRMIVIEWLKISHLESKKQKQQEAIVRCKDCKKRYTIHCVQEEVGNINNQDDWFCADGERRTT